MRDVSQAEQQWATTGFEASVRDPDLGRLRTQVSASARDCDGPRYYTVELRQVELGHSAMASNSNGSRFLRLQSEHM